MHVSMLMTCVVIVVIRPDGFVRLLAATSIPMLLVALLMAQWGRAAKALRQKKVHEAMREVEVLHRENAGLPTEGALAVAETTDEGGLCIPAAEGGLSAPDKGSRG